jgi:hypothetical protein
MGSADKIREYLDKNGWIQEEMFGWSKAEMLPGYYRSACLIGAASETGVMGDYITINIIVNVIEEQYSDRLTSESPQCSIVQFNDHPDTTYDDVILVLEKAAILEGEIA